MGLNKRQLDKILSSFLFEQVPSEAVADKLAHVPVHRFEKGETIYTPHTFRRAACFLLSGEAAANKGESILLNTLIPGDWFGVASLYDEDDDPFVTTILARKRCEVVFLDRGLLEELFEAAPRVAINYIAFLTRRIRFLNGRIDAFTASSAEAAVARHLLAQERDGVVEVTRGYANLAKQLGIGRATLYRVLDSLEEREVIRRKERRIEVVDREALKNMK